MNEVRLICADILEAPAPPMRGADEMLALARGARRRRSWLAASGVGGIVSVVVTAVLGLLAPAGIGPLIGMPVASHPERYPVARSAPTHSQQLLDKLRAVIPAAQIDVVAATDFGDQATVYPTQSPGPGGPPRLLAAAALDLVEHGSARPAFAYAYIVYDGQTFGPGDPCDGVPQQDGATCAMVTFRDVTVRVTTVDGQVEATRYLDGGRLIVGAGPGWPRRLVLGPSMTPRPGWAALPPYVPLTVDQIVELAADPAMLQFP